MNKIIQQIGALFLSLLIMMTTVSFTVDFHVCAGSVVDVSFAQEELSCTAALMGELSNEAHNAMREMGCCDDLQFQIEGQDEVQYGTEIIQLDTMEDMLAVKQSSEVEYLHISDVPNLYTTYIPPPLIPDVQILYQTFIL